MDKGDRMNKLCYKYAVCKHFGQWLSQHFYLLNDLTAYSKTFIPLAMKIQRITWTFLSIVAMATPCGVQTEAYMLLDQNTMVKFGSLTSFSTQLSSNMLVL